MTPENGSIRHKQRLKCKMRACLLWGLTLFVAANAGLLVATHTFLPHLRDPEYGYKLKLLRKRRAAEPERPLLVLLGSSRTGQGIRPGVLTDLDGRKPFVFNFSQVGSGPLAELVTLQRMLKAGVHPDWLAIEILPALLGRNIDACADPGSGVCRISWDDLQIVCRYMPDPQTIKQRWFKAQLHPWHTHRFTVMNHYAADSVPWRLRLDHWKSLDAWGWSDIGRDSQPLVTVPAALEVSRATYQPELQNFRISTMQDRALHDLLALCRQEKIPTLLYLMPEGAIFRSWYSPATTACVYDYLTRLSCECGVPIVDTRLWMEEKYFGDSHHLYRKGASLFTQRFGREVLARLVQGKEESMPNLLAPLTSYPDERREDEPRIQVEKSSERANVPMLSIHGGNPAAQRRR
jgi:hypothetical protein